MIGSHCGKRLRRMVDLSSSFVDKCVVCKRTFTQRKRRPAAKAAAPVSTVETTNTMDRVCLKHDLVLYGDEGCGECAAEGSAR
jgi:hypothetical protein